VRVGLGGLRYDEWGGKSLKNSAWANCSDSVRKFMAYISDVAIDRREVQAAVS